MEVGGPHHMQRSSYVGPTDRFIEASGFDFEYPSNVQLRFVSICSPKANKIRLLYQPHSHMYVQ